MKLFSAAWCTYCTPVKQLIEDSAMPVEIINVDTNPNIVAEYGIRGIPALATEDDTVITDSVKIMEYLRARFH